jgi:membrane-bound serine protease (ClpP class)
MTALGVSLLFVGALLILLEAHVPTLGVLGGPGVLALGAGAILAVLGLGGGVVLGVVAALLLAGAAGGVLAVTVGKGVAVRRRSVRAGPESLIGHLGVVRSWSGTTGSVLVDGALWRARRSAMDDSDESGELHPGDEVVVDHLDGLTVRVRRAEEWELIR